MPAISTNTAANSSLRYLNMNSAEQTDALNRIARGHQTVSVWKNSLWRPSCRRMSRL